MFSTTSGGSVVRRCTRWVGVIALSTVMVVGSAGVSWGAAAAQDYPAVDLSKLVVTEFPAGTPQTTATALDPGYVEKEFHVQGEASTYDGGLGTGPVEVTQTNVPYSTRVVVRYPKDASKFSGRVVVEPFNTTNGGKDLDAVWSMMAPLLQQRGDAWIGVTERTSAGEALKQADPPR